MVSLLFDLPRGHRPHPLALPTTTTTTNTIIIIITTTTITTTTTTFKYI